MHQTPQITLGSQPKTLFPSCTRETSYSESASFHFASAGFHSASTSGNTPVEGPHQASTIALGLQQEILFLTFTREGSYPVGDKKKLYKSLCPYYYSLKKRCKSLFSQIVDILSSHS